MAPAPVIRLHPDDGVLIARSSLPAGLVVAEGVTTVERIPAGHKVAIRPIAIGEPIHRYGQIIGFATKPISPGQHVHTQNCGMGDFAKDYAFGVDVKPVPNFDLPATFEGIRRPDGRVATRNYIGILTSVNCSAHVAGMVADIFKKNPFTGDNPLADFPNVDGVVALTHKTGCGMTQNEPLTLLRRTLGGYARHVNFSAVVVLGLGCEVNQIGGLMAEQKLAGRLRELEIQEIGGTRKTVEAGVAFVREELTDANKVRREAVPASELTVALQCGGSDGYSGISANPALGAASDLLVRHGGTVILSETPETYGAEHLLTRRAVSREVGEKLVGLMRWWEEYTAREGAEMDANPSPGNKAGGLTTILENRSGRWRKPAAPTSSMSSTTRKPSPRRVLCSWIRPATTRSRRRGRWLEAPISSASPPAAAVCSAASPRPRSSLRPTRRCTSAWKTTWTSIAAPSSTARRACSNAASGFST